MSLLPATIGTPAPSLSPALFARVVAIARREAGLTIPIVKTAMVQSRLARRLRHAGISAFEEYLALVEGPDGQDELREMISVLTTNVSHFFRELHHFDTLRDQVFPDLLARAASGGRVRIWSAGCSSGQEPYSLAMLLLRMDPLVASRDLRILATDIDPHILARAREGRYPLSAMGGVSRADQSAYFIKHQGCEPVFEVSAALRSLVTFRELNLLKPWPMHGGFDVVLCRNVVIYFDEATQAALWPRFEAVTRPGGWMFVGHSERISERTAPNFVSRGITTYQRLGAPA